MTAGPLVRAVLRFQERERKWARGVLNQTAARDYVRAGLRGPLWLPRVAGVWPGGWAGASTAVLRFLNRWHGARTRMGGAGAYLILLDVGSHEHVGRWGRVLTALVLLLRARCTPRACHGAGCSERCGRYARCGRCGRWGGQSLAIGGTCGRRLITRVGR